MRTGDSDGDCAFWDLRVVPSAAMLAFGLIPLITVALFVLVLDIALGVDGPTAAVVASPGLAGLSHQLVGISSLLLLILATWEHSIGRGGNASADSTQTWPVRTAPRHAGKQRRVWRGECTESSMLSRGEYVAV